MHDPDTNPLNFSHNVWVKNLKVFLMQDPKIKHFPMIPHCEHFHCKLSKRKFFFDTFKNTFTIITNEMYRFNFQMPLIPIYNNFPSTILII
jgi:hypothetical protein